MNPIISNAKIKIEDLLEKSGVEEKNLMIVEDLEDTKKCTVREFKQSSLLGDYVTPSRSKFYSSEKIQELVKNHKINLSTKADEKDLLELSTRVNQIITSNGTGKDSELVDARLHLSTLGDRLLYERELVDDKYMSKLKKEKVGNPLDVVAHNGYIDISVIADKTSHTNAGSLYITSKNILDYNTIVYSTPTFTKVDDIRGFKYQQLPANKKLVLDMKLPTIAPGSVAAGTYYFSADIVRGDLFTKAPLEFVVTYTDNTVSTYDYNYEEMFRFEALKSIKQISLKFDEEKSWVDNTSVTFGNIMLSKEMLSVYTPFFNEIKTVKQLDNLYNYKNNNYTYETTLANTKLKLFYNDNEVTTNTICEDIEDIKYRLNDGTEKCGLITNYGTYQFFDNAAIISYPANMTMKDSTEEFMRNNKLSKKITIDRNVLNGNAMIKQTLDNPIDIISFVTLSYYIDRTIFVDFADKEGIKIHLSSDPVNTDIANYYSYTITKKEMVQGWNNTKHRLSDFTTTGSPDANKIKSVTIEISINPNLLNKSFYLNSIVFNQEMKPTILLSFDGTFTNSIPYLYPYLAYRNIPATLFLNNAKTLNAAAFDSIIKMRVQHKWDIGAYGCNPNKELLSEDTNYRNQYINLRQTKLYLQENMVDNPTSYSAPYGNLRPITVPILKDLGFNIARVASDAYCSIFTEKDFAIPMQEITNEYTLDQIKSRIDECIYTGQTLSLYTRDVTEYGSEADATQTVFESVINYIIEKRDEGSLDVLTFKQFYDKCVK